MEKTQIGRATETILRTITIITPIKKIIYYDARYKIWTSYNQKDGLRFFDKFKQIPKP